MPASAKLAILLAWALCTLGASSRGASTIVADAVAAGAGATDAGAAGAVATVPEIPPAATGAAPAVSACDRRLVSARDAAAILGAPIVVARNLQGDPQSCVFKAADSHSLTVSVRPALGRATVATWAAGKMDSTATPLAGVGESAVWIEDLGEVEAQQGDLLCVVSAPGLRGGPGAPRSAASSRKLGALCNQVFAGS